MRLNPTEAYEPISSLEVGDDDELAEAVMEALTEISPILDLD